MKSDAQITEDVLNALKWSPQVREEHIGVTVHNGAVTLTGHVPNYWEKRAAKETAKHVTDVKAIVDEVQVRLEREMRMTDEGLAERIANVLKWNVSAQGQDVRAEIVNGIVTLTGRVDRQDQRTNIEHNVDHVAGIVDVVNQIAVTPHVSLIDVEKRIREALERHANIEASTVSVATASHDTVILSGTAESIAELERIEETAWAAPGAAKVINNIRIAP